MENNNQKRSENKKTIIILIFIIIILLLLIFLLLKRGILDNNNQLIPTGNVDIFEINCTTNCACKDVESGNEKNNESTTKKGNQPTTSSNSNGYSSENNNTKSSENGNVNVYDKNMIWQSTNKLKIFENPVYQMDEIIAPLSTNSYEFVIQNSISSEVIYQLKFDEVNNYNINMKYRLKRNGNYVKGNENEWVTYKSLNISSINIASNSQDTYYLEWKWFESDNDTAIGSIQSTYSLSITLSAEQKI